LDQGRTRLSAAARGLPRPQELLATPSQRFDLAAGRLGAGLERNVAVHERRLAGWASRLNRGLLDRPRDAHARRLSDLSARMKPAVLRHSARAAERLANLDKLLTSLDPRRPPRPGLARVMHADGKLAMTAASLASGEAVSLVFADGARGAMVDGTSSGPALAPSTSAPPRKAAKGSKTAPGQGDLF